MNGKKFVDEESGESMKVQSTANFIGFEINGESVVFPREQFLNEILPFLRQGC